VTEPAERESSAQTRLNARDDCPADGSLGWEIPGLPWIAPSATSLGRLAALPTSATWPALRDDPGAVLLLLRSDHSADPLPFPEALLLHPAPLEFALRQLERPATGVLEASIPAVRTVYNHGLTLARLARALAVRAGSCDPEQAWCAGLLAPLGWLGVCAVSPAAATACLADPAFRRHSLETQTRHFGIDQAALTRRLASNWGLPAWLASVLGRLELPPDHARRFGAPAALFSIVRLAIHLAREHGSELGLAGEIVLADEEAAAGLSIAELRAEELLGAEAAQATLESRLQPVCPDPAKASSPTPVPAALDPCQNPYGQPLLREMLAVAIDNRRLQQAGTVARLEREVDELHAALRDQVHGESARLRSAKLLALAEFAAGAGHEINNPLAVISGQAQYLLSHEADFFVPDGEDAPRKALQTIIGQTKRIHGILRDLMQFARPAPPRPSWLDLPTLMGEVAASLTDMAAQKRVRVEMSARPERLAVYADSEQVRMALMCLLRNAIEAAPADGFARLVLAEPGPADRVEVVVEDSGTGPSAEQRLHLFDPFYSGRSAGRGRGLGLPIAWRLARQQGGDLHLEPARPGAPTRFVLSLPRPMPQVDARPAA
jgi:signal transduction histidine kinase